MHTTRICLAFVSAVVLVLSYVGLLWKYAPPMSGEQLRAKAIERVNRG